MNYYITFGQSHVHKLNGWTLDKDIVLVIQAATFDQAAELVNNLFDLQYSRLYSEDKWKEVDPDEWLRLYPRGYHYLHDHKSSLEVRPVVKGVTVFSSSAELPPPPCVWKFNSADMYWVSECGMAFVFDNDTNPLANGFRYCPSCGKRLEEHHV